MANRNFLFVNSDTEIQEEVLSVTTSAGAGDSGKLATLDANGKWDTSLLPDSLFNGYDWKGSVRVAAETNITLSGPGASIDSISMNNGDRVLLAGQTDPSENGLYVFNGAASALTRTEDADDDVEVTSQMRVAIEEGTRANQIAYLTAADPITVDTTNLTFQFQNPVALVGGDGIDISAGTVSVDLASADSGLEFVSNQLSLDFADTSVTADLDGTNEEKPVRAEDIYGNGVNQGANILGVDPASISQSSQTLLQGVLEDMSAAILANDGQTFTVGAGGVTLGDLVYISANDTVLPLDINAEEFGIGLAATTESAAADVQVYENGEVLAGAISGATAGDKYYWDGSTLTTTAPSGSGNRVWMVGVAKNATDLYVEVRRIKRNA